MADKMPAEAASKYRCSISFMMRACELATYWAATLLRASKGMQMERRVCTDLALVWTLSLMVLQVECKIVKGQEWRECKIDGLDERKMSSWGNEGISGRRTIRDRCRLGFHDPFWGLSKISGFYYEWQKELLRTYLLHSPIGRRDPMGECNRDAILRLCLHTPR